MTFYLQTDLDGIKWRKLTAENTCFADPLEDPVLQSFTRCIQSDILCVWRRVQSSGSSEQKVTDQLSCSKELWIFWYGDEPHNLSNLLSQDLQGMYAGQSSPSLYMLMLKSSTLSTYRKSHQLVFIAITLVKCFNWLQSHHCNCICCLFSFVYSFDKCR